MPTLFFGHGNPMNAIQSNEWTLAWRALAREFPKPEAILSISAHWYPPMTLVTAQERPRTIHDFGGFPAELYEVSYPVIGDSHLCTRISDLLTPVDVGLARDWGIDHGTWSVLCHLYPEADVPVVQLSIDETLSAGEHYELGRKLAPLRDEGVLVMGSGNLVHNLHAYSWGKRPVEPYDWALRFEKRARELMLASDHHPLIEWEAMGRDAMLSAPTPDHYLPLLYVLGAGMDGDPVSFPTEGFDGGSVSMLSVRLG
ncbi:MAG: 4,5-DOPA dioxygenase extradiol [Thermoanaerobaculia bacterium]